MTHLVRWFPVLDHKGLPYERKPRKPHKKQEIPAMYPERGASHIKHSDELVIEIILNHLRTGQHANVLSEIYGIEWGTIQNWLDADNRRQCWHKAMKIYRDELKPKV